QERGLRRHRHADRLLQRARHGGRDRRAGALDDGYRGPGGHGGDRLGLLSDEAVLDPVLVNPMSGTPLVELRDVRKSFAANQVLRGISLELDRGTTLAVMGGSGSGKTVLLRIIDGLLLPDSGEVSLFGTRIERM